MASRPRILTFNFHEPYLCLLAKTGFDFTVGLYRDPPLSRTWQTCFRPVPPNMQLVDEPAWRADLAAGRFDVVIAHNESNALDLLKYDTPKLLVCHNRKTFLSDASTAGPERARELYAKLLERLREGFRFVFISESKRDDYGLSGTVILPGIEVEEFGGYTGEVPEVLRVGNVMRDRNLMFDVDFQEAVCRGMANRVVGTDPRIPGAQPSRSYQELLYLYRSRRCLLHVTREEYEDGYNLALLEAMACGMPAVSLSNKTSPLTDGVDGFVSCDADVLRGYVRDLLADLDLAQEIGARGRETVARKFPMSAFVDRWRETIEAAAQTKPGRARQVAPSKTRTAAVPERRLNLVLHYIASPFTTGRYFEQAARKHHAVVTAGFRCPEETLLHWGFTDPPAYSAHQIDLPLHATCEAIRSGLPEGFHPDAYLWIDSGLKEAPQHLDRWSVPKICYLIDTHIAPEPRVEIARQFDHVFLAQKGQVEQFRAAGLPHARWLPLACSAELHDLPPTERVYDVGYVGSISGDATDHRANLLRRVADRFPNSKIGRFWPDEMARIYAQAKIVVNACVNRDVNMRVFEAMASGALLITDEADGLDDLFENGVHLVVYRNEQELFDLIDAYLRDDAARERIAEAGARLVGERHTYDLRLAEILSALSDPAARPKAFASHDPYAPGGYYRNTRPEIAQFVPLAARRLLDVGCGCGDFGKALKDRGLVEVQGIEIVPEACTQARQTLDGAIQGSIEEIALPFEDGHFDCVTFADVLEHLVDPAAALRKVERVLAPDGVIVMSIPNVRFYAVVAMLIDGRWKYEELGILDRTHLRFFTAMEMHELVKSAGLEVLNIQALSYVTPDRLPRNADGSVTLGRATLWPVDDADYDDLRTYQYIVIAGKPGADRLAKARQALEIERNEAAIVLAEEARGVDEVERRHIMGRALARLGQLKNAEARYREALDVRPQNAAIEGELGILLVAMNRASDARPFLERALDADPENDRVRGALGLVRMTEGRDAEAFDCFLAALDASFENSALLPHLVQVAEKLERLAEIEDLARRFADFYPGNTDVVCACATVLSRLGHTKQARSYLDMLKAIFPDSLKKSILLQEALAALRESEKDEPMTWEEWEISDSSDSE